MSDNGRSAACHEISDRRAHAGQSGVWSDSGEEGGNGPSMKATYEVKSISFMVIIVIVFSQAYVDRRWFTPKANFVGSCLARALKAWTT